MARPLIEAIEVSKAYAGKVLFDHASIRIEAADRLALVGPNGSGKSTLLAILRGSVPPDDGQVRTATRLRIVSFDQHPKYKPNATGRDVMAEGMQLPPHLSDELASLTERMADPALYEGGQADSVLSRFGDLQREIQLYKSQSGAGEEGSALLEDLGFTGEDLARPVASLSGGERTRLFLAQALSHADPSGVIFLDEPTNHLDVETIEWLEDWLLEFQGTSVFVAHDRAFLDNVATRVCAIEQEHVNPYEGNYSEYERVRDEDSERLRLQKEKEAQELDRQKAVIEQFRHQKRFNGQMASRLTRLAKYKATIDRTPDPLVDRVQFSVAFPTSFKSSNEVLRVRGLGKKFGERVLFYDLDFDLMKGDRVGLLGANGVGKTTFLRILTGREPRQVGTIEAAPGVKGAFYAQGNEDLKPERSLGDEVLSARSGLSDEDVRALLGRFGFRGRDDPTRIVRSLSGGERARLALLKCVIGPSNLLILDEPTNHLDIESCEALVGALNAYKGTLLVVSHDRWFLDSIVNKVAVLARREIRTFVGDVSSARVAEEIEQFSNEKPVAYVVRKGFKDFEAGVRYAVGSEIKLTAAEFAAKRLWKTAVAVGWMAPES
ncbi:MAG: ABC-F family ATP-binding cassette domain-containing protein [Thermoplasmatota archaeon]